MAQNKTAKSMSFLFLIILILFINGCKEPVEFQSKWLDKNIVIDANDTDWTNYSFFYHEKPISRIGLYNDDKNLYIYFQTTDKDLIRQISGQGLFLWFNKTGKKDKELALFFPSGRRFGGGMGPHDMASGRPDPSQNMAKDRPDPPSNKQDNMNMVSERKLLQGAAPDEELKILSSEKDKGYKCNLEKAKNLGIEVMYTIDDSSRFVYELKMPIVETANTAFVAEASETNNIGIGFITGEEKGKHHHGEMEREGMKRGPMDDGNMQRNEMFEEMGNRPMPDEGMEKPGKSFEIWFNVTLAPKPVE